MHRKRLYIIFILLTIAGYGWIFLNFCNVIASHDNFTVCLFKYITGIPCPSCGITRSIIFLMHRNIIDAFSMNPLGIVVAVALIVLPVLILSDLLFKRDSFIRCYNYLEKAFTYRWVSIPAIFMILFIWVINICKKL